jgi:hypothetical protein
MAFRVRSCRNNALASRSRTGGRSSDRSRHSLSVPLGLTQAIASGVVIGGAQVSAEPQRLGGDAVTRARVDWKRWTLWASLVLDVVVLGWMALRLGRQMSRPA